ncbi:hypothetical protein BU15DRAFT_83576 [Melanogaster broomeanus]|nr:hypothetical protein BU15DRAFT_83576 [Melanogaster broomeanus]
MTLLFTLPLANTPTLSLSSNRFKLIASCLELFWNSSSRTAADIFIIFFRAAGPEREKVTGYAISPWQLVQIQAFHSAPR